MPFYCVDDQGYVSTRPAEFETDAMREAIQVLGGLGVDEAYGLNDEGVRQTFADQTPWLKVRWADDDLALGQSI